MVDEEAPSDVLVSAETRRSALSRRDYLVGIGLLMVVVFLWTSSNFVTQVRHEYVSDDDLYL